MKFILMLVLCVSLYADACKISEKQILEKHFGSFDYTYQDYCIDNYTWRRFIGPTTSNFSQVFKNTSKNSISHRNFSTAVKCDCR